uniref:Uncharacterized protein n=1 Tax=Arundo donax TaxID=35708 RepID=A0A0A8YSE2_ARUDO
MSTSSEKMYNWSFTNNEGAFGSGSSSAKLGVHHKKHIAVPSKFKTYLYVNTRPRITVNNLESDVYDVTLALSESEYADNIVIDYKNISQI